MFATTFVCSVVGRLACVSVFVFKRIHCTDSVSYWKLNQPFFHEEKSLLVVIEQRISSLFFNFIAPVGKVYRLLVNDVETLVIDRKVPYPRIADTLSTRRRFSRLFYRKSRILAMCLFVNSRPNKKNTATYCFFFSPQVLWSSAYDYQIYRIS